MHFEGLNAFALFLGRAGERVGPATAEAAREAAIVLKENAQHLFGHAPPLAELADSTQAERMQLGFSADEPLLRSGGLQSEVHAYATRTMAVIESTNPIQAYHEYGYTTTPFGNPRAEPVSVPPRPVFRYALEMSAPFVRRLGGQIIRRVHALGVEGEE